MDRRRLAGAAASVLALLVLAAAGPYPSAPGGNALLAPVPDDGGCTETTPAPGSTPGPGQAESCEGSGAGSDDLGVGAIASMLPLVALVVAAVLVIALTGVALAYRLPAGVPPEPIEGWWTCAACGASNLRGSPRCHRCGAWPPTAEPPPPGRITA